MVFATDTWGNVYQMNYSYNAETGTWSWSNWMPFYGKRLKAWQTGLMN